MIVARHTLTALLCAVMLNACASRQASLRQEPPAESLPEVRSIVLLGNETFGDARLRRVMATQQRSLLSPWKRGSDHNPAAVDADLLRLQKFYFDRGYLEVRATLAGVEQNEAGKAVQLRIEIEEGEPTLVREVVVEVEGRSPPGLPSVDELGSDLPLRVGRPITKAAFDASREQLLMALQTKGYARARIRPRTEVDPRRREAFVRYTIETGEPTIFGQVSIKGAANVKTEAIRRRLAFRPGEVYSPARVSDSQAAIYDLGMFRAVTPRSLNPEAAGEPLDIEFEVSERPPRSFEVGLGLSTIERFRLQVGWIFRNVFGAAQHLSLSGKASSLGTAFETRFRLPHFFTPRTRFTQTAFVDSQEEINTDPLGLTDRILDVEDAQPAFDVLRYGAESRVDHQFGRRFGAAVGIELSSNTFSHVDPQAIEELDSDVAVDHFLFTQFAELTWNTSDRAINATRGLLALFRAEHSGTGILSEFDFVKAVVEGRRYVPLWRRATLAARLKLGFVQPYGQSEVMPFNVRFFAGGPGSVRGYALNRVGPRATDGAPLGGHSLIEGSMEVRFPVIGEFGGVFFVDFGQVFEASLEYDLKELRYAAGPGIRYNTPIGPVRFDVGFIIDGRPDEPFGRIELSILQAF